MFSHPNTMDSCNASHMQLEKHMLEVESSVFCFDPGHQMMSMLRRWEIGVPFSKNTLHITITESEEGKRVEGS